MSHGSYAAKDLSAAQQPPAGKSRSAELALAFEQFSNLSEQLTSSYRDLEARVSQLTGELNRASDQRLEALEAKEQIANRLENLLDFLPGGVVVLDPRGRITDCNPVALEMLGEPLMGELWRKVIGRCFAPRQDDGHEVSTRDGRRISIATRSLEDHGQIILLTDQTETRRLQAQLSRHERLMSMGKMVSALAHQIRTPLSAAMLYADHLGRDNLSPEQQQRFADKLQKRLSHMEQQVRDMLLFVKGDLTLNEQLSLQQLQDKLLEAVEPVLSQPLTSEKGAQCQWQLCEESAHAIVRCNSDVLVSALMNLVNNGIQAGGDNARISIAFAIEAGVLSIAVADNGPGLEPAVLAAIGDAFVTTKPQGMGLGLSVVRTVAKAHGGDFDIGNLPEGGARAEIRIPIQGYGPAQ